MDAIAEFAGLLAAFREHEVDHALCGGLALAVHGHIRATEDIDILIEAESLPRARKVAGLRGFTIMGADLKFSSGTRLIRLMKSYPGTEDSMVLDLIVANEVNWDAWSSRHDVNTRWGPIRVVSRDALRAMKLRSARPVDLEDVRRLDGGSS